MAGANPEQLKAIENFGGALLSAGAGSGKTFVLTEHLVHLATQWIENYNADRDGIFDQYIKSKLTKVVLMTFTKKAAGEIGIRIGQKFQRGLDEATENQSPTAILWEKTFERLDSLTVSTIHGYCYKLIKQGFFAQVNPNDEIIGEAEFSKQIEDIFSDWLEDNLERSDQFFKTILKERRAVLTSLKSIVSDPTLRLMWQKMDPDSFDLMIANQVIKDLLWHQSFNEIFEEVSPLGQWSDFSDKDWFKFLERFESFRKSFDFSLTSLNSWILELSNDDWKIPRAPSAKAVPQDAKDFYKQVKEFKDFLKKNEEDLLLFEEHGVEKVQSWYGQFRELFTHVEKSYRSAPGFTFGDLEYIVNEQLESPSAREMVKNEYDYIIVDEFQDTSFIQFNILSKIVDGNYSKVFCVGDVKQAIYGFRGGELGVFLEMEEKTPLRLSLLHNYRSDQDVIRFNNSLFDYLFKLGLGFEGRDHYAVKVERQTIPLADRAQGKIFEIETNLEFLENELEKLSVSDVEYLEALALADNIKKNLNEDQATAVLYRKLKPSKILMQLLLAMDIGFTSQVKVPMLEDPILGLFNLLIKNKFDQGQLKDKYLEFALVSYFKLLGATAENVVHEAHRFEENISYYGLYQSFLIFMSSTGLVVSNYKNNLENIKLVIDMSQGDLGKIVTKMDEWSELQYSLDFQYGKDPHKVVLMSAHASKGLEFPRVLLGGIYTNDSSMGMKDMFGKSPYSFKWSQELTGKKKYKSPHYMLELAVQKRKEFSESKRLFYVACTRAESELGWVKLEFGKLKATVAKGSWISGLNKFFQDCEEGMLFYKDIANSGIKADLKDVFDISFLQKMSNQPPMFHFDNLGVESRIDQAQAFLMPELSVTRLAQVSQCPRKFYLQNILKLESSTLFKEDSKSMDLEELSSKSFSSSERGIEVHDAIAQAIDNNLIPKIELGHASQVDWVVENLKGFAENTNFISEKPIKFELFQYMISGIPDLIIQDNENEQVEVWDFKTGRLKTEAPESYWFQLKTYAYAMYATERAHVESPIKLVLCYVDEKQMVEQIVSKKDVEKYLWDYASKLNSADEVNPDSCDHCDFNKICKKKSLSSCATSFSC